jgi:hypothetical protein
MLAYMERIAPDVWGPPKVRAELSGPDGAPLSVQVVAPLTLAEALKRVESLREQLAADVVDGELDDEPTPVAPGDGASRGE